jgi:hypothetical protein
LWQSNNNAKWQALAYFWLENQQATSPLAASFGGFDFDNELSDKQLFAFVEAVFCWLKTQQIHTVQIIQAPVCYQVHYPRLQEVLALFSLQYYFRNQSTFDCFGNTFYENHKPYG